LSSRACRVAAIISICLLAAIRGAVLEGALEGAKVERRWVIGI
jgi:hypothetical protein